MRKIRAWIRTSKVGSKCEDVIEVPEGISDNDLEELARDVAFNYMEWGYEDI